MSVTDVAAVFSLIRDLKDGVTILREFDVNGVVLYEGITANWNADPTKAIWWVVKFSQSGSPSLENKVQYSPPNQIWNDRASIFP